MPHPDAGSLPFSIGNPFDPSLIVAYNAKDPEDVAHWLENGVEGWCIPDERMGPDLIACLELEGGKKLVLFVQCKVHTTRNKTTVRPEVMADAIQSVTPSNFFASLVHCWLISSYKFIDFHCLLDPRQ